MFGKESCLTMVDLIVDCANYARIHGVLSLETWVRKHENDFLAFCLMLVCDGVEPSVLKNIGERLIKADNHAGEELLCRQVLLEGALAVQVGENPRVIEIKLLAMLGEKYLKERGYYSGEVHDPAYERRMLKMARQTGLPQSEEFNMTFESMSNHSIQLLLREISVICMVTALKGCNAAAGLSFLRNMSRRLAASMLEEAEHMGDVPEKDILAAQQEILYTYVLLRDKGSVD
ncbi:MAG: hypothetical protein FWE90_13995 [Defluviitaleaceae bacterium]|nr:hypothetical protein [Defluviitaleaceae bacterium]